MLFDVGGVPSPRWVGADVVRNPRGEGTPPPGNADCGIGFKRGRGSQNLVFTPIDQSEPKSARLRSWA
jgi:hypothetical protein